MGKIELTGMRFFARHGCLESERELGNEFLVDFSCDFDTSYAERSDDLADTLDYSLVYGIVARQMEIPSMLLEHVACRIADALEEELPDLKHFELRVSKKNPPVGGDCEWARITLKK